jgi:O-methyltransferase involved in polyketide biosynthesis
MEDGQKTRVDLEGVPETLLWTLYHRALEARRPDAVLRDPMAVELVDAIDYPFEQRFGTGNLGLAQWQALRARCFDQEVRRFLSRHPDGTVVALGEGLETQFWRVDNGRVEWLTVDLPQSIDLRRQLLPASPRQRTIACSALDRRWMDEVDTSRGVLVTAQGLLMYLQPSEVRGLIAACAQRFAGVPGGGALLFDAVPRWLSQLSVRARPKTPGGFQAPPWLWGMDKRERERIRTAHPSIAELRELRLPRGRGLLFGYLLPLLSAIAPLRIRLLSIMLVRFGPPAT